MTFEQFKYNMRGLNLEDGNDISKKDFDAGFLEKTYNDIQSKKFEFNFTKHAPGIEIHSDILKVDPVYKQFSNAMGLTGNIESFKENSPVFKDNKDNFEIKVDKPKIPILSKLTGYQGTMTIKDKESQAEVTVQVYKPSAYASYFGDKPKMVIQPKTPDSKESLELCGKIAASLKTHHSSMNFKSTYDYQKEPLEKAYSEQKAAIKTEAWTSRASAPTTDQTQRGV